MDITATAILQVGFTALVILAVERGRVVWRGRQVLRRRREIPQAPTSATLHYAAEAWWIGAVVGTFFLILLGAAGFSRAFGPAVIFLAFSALGWGLFSYCRGLTISYDTYSLTTRFRRHTLADMLWKDIVNVQAASQPGLIFLDGQKRKLHVPQALVDFDALCTSVLRQLAPGTPMTLPAVAEILGNARAEESELLKLYVPHFLAEPAIHAFLWDPANDPYESWQEVAFQLAYRLYTCRGSFSPFVLALEPDGKVRGRAGLEPPQAAKSWTSCQPQAGGVKLCTLVEGGTVRELDVPLRKG